jgi:hypothetical protein
MHVRAAAAARTCISAWQSATDAADETDAHILGGGPPIPCRSRPVGL